MAFTIIAITIAFINKPLIIFRFKFNIIGHAYFSPLFTQVTNSPYTRVEIPGPLSLSLLFFFLLIICPGPPGGLSQAQKIIARPAEPLGLKTNCLDP